MSTEASEQAAVTSAKFCSSCGAALSAPGSFCPQCGNSTAAVPGPAGRQPVPVMWVVLAAGIVTIAGSFLPWVSVTAPLLGTVGKSGIEMSDGWLSVGLGVLLAGYAALRLWPIRLPAAVTIVAGFDSALIIGLGIAEFVSLLQKAGELKSSLSGQDDAFGIGAAFSAAVRVEAGAGLWLLTAAGLIGAAALVLDAARRGDSAKVVGVVGASVVLIAGGLTSALVLAKNHSAPAATATTAAASTVKGVVAPVDSVTVELAEGHYLKLGFSVQFNDKVSTPPDLGGARQAAIDTYAGRPVAAFGTEEGRAQVKSELLTRVQQAYPGKVLDVYITTLVTQ